MKHIKLFESVDESDIHDKIKNIIDYSLYLRDVRYGEDGQQEVDPESIEDATKDIMSMLKKEGVIK